MIQGKSRHAQESGKTQHSSPTRLGFKEKRHPSNFVTLRCGACLSEEHSLTSVVGMVSATFRDLETRRSG